MESTSENLMTRGSIPGKILRFAFPVFLGNLFQQLYSTVDALIVGNFVGTDALAAVSATGTLVFLLISFFEGIAIGAGVAVSRYFGAEDDRNVSLAVHTNIAFALSVGVLLSVLGPLAAPVILRWMGTPADILPQASAYVRIYFGGILTLVMYNTCRGILQAVGDSRHPLIYLIISSVTNVVLDLVFICIFRMGVEGAAIATILSQLLSAALCILRLLRTPDAFGIRIRRIGFDGPMLKEIINYGVPTGVQNSVIAFANVIVQSCINVFGTLAVAGCGAYTKLEGFGFLPITAFNIALTTFVGQNLGAREFERAKKGAAFGIVCAILLAEAIGVSFDFAAPQLIGLFTADAAAIAFGVQKMRIVSLFYCLLAATHSFAAILRGAGKSVIPMAVMLICWCLFRVVFLTITTPIYHNIALVNWVYPISWSASTVILIIYYIRADWIHGFEKQESSL